MSSEVYVRWEVENLQELHKQLKQKLEKERQQQAKLFGNIKNEINKIKNEVSASKNTSEEKREKNSISIERLNNFIEVESAEKVISGFSEEIEYVNSVDRVIVNKKLETIDLSQYVLINNEITEQEKKQKLVNEINLQLSTAVINNDLEIKEINSFVAYVNGLLMDEELDYEYFCNLVRRRFQKIKNKLMIMDVQDISEEMLEYFAICNLLGVKPKNIEKEEVIKEIEILCNTYIENEKNDYVYKNLLEVFSELDMVIVDEMELDGLSGKMLVSEKISDCAIFMSMDGDGIIFETVAEVENDEAISMNQKNDIENKVNAICKKHKEVIKKMQERGISIKIECEELDNAEQIRKIEKKSNKKRIKSKNKEKMLRSN